MEWPENFEPQVRGLIQRYADLVKRGPAGVHDYFVHHRDEAEAVLTESYNKRYAPSTFIQEHEGGYRVGWYEHGYKCTRSFRRFEAAISDYLLFSYGIGRFEEGK